MKLWYRVCEGGGGGVHTVRKDGNWLEYTVRKYWIIKNFSVREDNKKINLSSH